MPMYGSRDDISPERYLRRIRFVSDLSLYLSLPRSRSSVGIEESFEFHLPTYLASYEAKPVRPMLTLRFPFPHRLACTDIKEPRILANTLNPKRRERKKNWEIKKKDFLLRFSRDSRGIFVLAFGSRAASEMTRK